MTLAICLKCGETKFGAIVPCDQCGFQPRTDKELAYSMALSDHHQKPDILRNLGQSLKSGQIKEVRLFPEQEEALIAAIRKSGIRRMCGIASPISEENEVISYKKLNFFSRLWRRA